jgi:hypothetical protein
MTGKNTSHGHPVHHAKPLHHAEHEDGGRRQWGELRRGLVRLLRRKAVRRLVWGAGIALGIFGLAFLGLLWRLSRGPIELDMATPWLKAAIEDNFGGKHSVAVGGTQIERDENGRTSLRLRDIVVRDADGTVVASAPKAEVGLNGLSLLSGHLRAESLNLVGAETAVRIETDGRVTVFAGADKRPIATAVPEQLAPAAAGPLRAGFEDVAGVLAWIDGLGVTGLDGHDLRELGLKNGNLIVDDQRNGKRWTFNNINVSLTRPQQGGVIFRVASDDPNRPWELIAAMRPLGDGVRAVGIEARKVSARDLLLAMRLGDGDIVNGLPLSASMRGEIAPDGTPLVLQGELVAEAGTIVDPDDDSGTIAIDHADVKFSWDAHRRTLIVPFQIQSGGNQFTMRAELEGPGDDSGIWNLNMTRGDAVIDPVILVASGQGNQEAFALNRTNVRARIDMAHKRIEVDQGDFSRIDTRPSLNVGVAFSGSVDFSGAELRLAFGVAGTRMPMSVMIRMWPVFAATHVRAWAVEHISDGTVERVVIAGNATLSEFKAGGLPMPDEGLSIDIETSGTTLQPIANLPPIRDADLTVRVTGSAANVSLGRGTVEVAPGRKLNIASGVFAVPNTHLKPSPASAQFRIDGTVPAVATLLASDALRDTAGLVLDPATSRGTVTAQVTLNLKLTRAATKDPTTYSVTADFTNFAADNILMGQKIEAAALRVAANSNGYQIKGDVKINGTPSTLDLRKAKDDADGELKLLATIDEAARNRLGIDFGNSVTGSIPVKVTGRVGANDKDERVNVEADLTPVKIDNLLPGWVKPAGKPARATYTLVKNDKSMRFDDLTIDGSGVTVKGVVEVDNAGQIVSANFPVFSLSDGDKVTLKADRGGDGALRVTMRGDVYDGRNFVKSSLAGAANEKSKQKEIDLDLDIKIGTVAGYNGEALRALDLKLSRRGGRIRNFLMNSKIGRDSPLIGDLRLRSRDNHQVIYFETDDAGALFKFVDMYPHMFNGQMWVAMDPPAQEQAPQVGTLNIRNFVVRGEPALERVVAGAQGLNRGGVEFSEMHAEFTRFPGKMAVREGVVRGPLVGATIDGQIDYAKDEVHLRGTFVPFYGLNNMFGQIPIVGLILGGGANEGLLGINYEAVGPVNAPRISVNPVSAIAPGVLRKFIPSPGTFDPNFIPPTR